MANEKTAVVFIHGFMGSFHQFDELCDKLEDCGARLVRPILPGHECGLEEFLQTNGDTWQKHIADTVDELRKDYDRIILVGHSMGGLIATREAVRSPQKISRVIAIGYPIMVTVRPQWLMLNVRASRPARENEDPRITVARNMAGVHFRGIDGYLKTLPNNIEFLKIAKDTRAQLSRLSVPLTVLNFKKDEIVSGKTRKFVMERQPETEFYLFDDSYHFLFSPEDTERMADVIRREINAQQSALNT